MKTHRKTKGFQFPEIDFQFINFETFKKCLLLD